MHTLAEAFCPTLRSVLIRHCRYDSAFLTSHQLLTQVSFTASEFGSSMCFKGSFRWSAKLIYEYTIFSVLVLQSRSFLCTSIFQRKRFVPEILEAISSTHFLEPNSVWLPRWTESSPLLQWAYTVGHENERTHSSSRTERPRLKTKVEIRSEHIPRYKTVISLGISGRPHVPFMAV